MITTIDDFSNLEENDKRSLFCLFPIAFCKLCNLVCTCRYERRIECQKCNGDCTCIKKNRGAKKMARRILLRGEIEKTKGDGQRPLFSYCEI